MVLSSVITYNFLQPCLGNMKLLDCRLGMSCSQGRQQAEVHMEQIELTVLVGEGEAVVVATMGAVSDIDHIDSIHYI